MPSALQLEFRENKGDLEFHMESPLSQKPLSIDLLVLVRSPGAVMHNPLGAIFSFVLRRVPKKLLNQLKEYHFRVENPSPGIYYIHTAMFREPHIQIIATSQLGKNEHLWLTSLARDLTEDRAVRLAEAIGRLKAKDDLQFADSVLHVAISENRRVFKNIMEVPDMCDALRELFQPEIDLLEAQLAEKDSRLAEKDAEIDRSNEIIRQLQAQLAAAGITQ